MSNIGNLVSSRFGILFLLAAVFVSSCEKWTPPADAYYIVDGTRYSAYVMVTGGVPESPLVQSQITTFYLNLQGASAYTVDMSVMLPPYAAGLEAGVYAVSSTYLAGEVNPILIRVGTSGYIQSDQNSTGSLTIKVSGDIYTLDFNGQVGGHTVVMHYSGRVSVQNLI